LTTAPRNPYTTRGLPTTENGMCNSDALLQNFSWRSGKMRRCSAGHAYIYTCLPGFLQRLNYPLSGCNFQRLGLDINHRQDARIMRCCAAE
jgi:hypothetical protein